MTRSGQTGIALLLAAIMTGASGLGGQVLAATDVHPSLLPWLHLAGDLLGDEFVARAAQAVAGPTAISAGSDGRITVLMVGSDWRASSNNGERLDTIMVMSLNPNNHQISAVSIPRDSARVPLPPSLGGGTFKGKINGMFKWFKKQSGGDRAMGLEKFRQAIEYVIDTPIDYVAFIRFDGFDTLVDDADGVISNIPLEIHDKGYIDKPGWPKGAKFLANASALLLGASAPRCYGGYPKPVTNWAPVPNCTRALVYVRSRKGTVGGAANNDYKRAKRQQTFVFETIKRVRASLTRAQTVRSAANQIPSDFYTTIPITTVADGLALYELVQDVTMPNQAVFSPPTYASHIPGSSSNQLKLTAIRALCDSWMGPV
jgi:anionic cell wall polymer biosynthesis LytR-Cps2A-Psr (LCP) family protein